jgi:phosphatidylserine/phosphatidylglycerophosphate/cardiolipin synthase-like enzyme
VTEAPLGLSMLALPDLERLRALVSEGRIGVPLTDGALRAGGFTRFADHLVTTFAGLNPHAICVVLDAAVAERVRRPPPRLKLVWTGPEGQGSTARDTGLLVSELFGGARESVLIAGFRFDHGADIFAPLHRVMRDEGVRATIFIDIDIKGEEKTVHGAQAYAGRAVDLFFRHNWPFGEPMPKVYYDPRTALPGPPWVSLHAKCIVVDERLTFVTSANFTDRGQARNTELGVLIEDGEFAERGAEWVGGRWLLSVLA